MIKETEIKLPPSEISDPGVVKSKAAKALGINPEDITEVVPLRRSIDARGKNPVFRMRVAVYIGEHHQPQPAILDQFKNVGDRPKVLIVGAGPTGYFAALELIELGFRPIVFDRGKDVRARRRDLRAIQQFGVVNPDSNYCFGEGGAGTYSDGKLYTRSHKRGNIEKALRLLVEHGAKSDIMVDAHPHIGSNKLPKIVANIRDTILHFGGEIHFASQVTDFVIHQDQIKGVIVNASEEHTGDAVILATGHSARDIYELLHRLDIHIEAKPFALGVRVEHPQALIDKIQYNQASRDRDLPAASYRLAVQVDGRGVFSFCMCPGGLVVPAATAPGELVVNGMSMSRRDSAFANSGIVVAVELEDLKPYAKHGPFAALAFQREVEQKMFGSGDGSQQAPAQRLPDFVAGRESNSLAASSYIPGLRSAPLHQLLPKAFYHRLQQSFRQFDKKMKGYFSGEANVIGVESRTSAPVRIPRNPETLQHDQVKGLFPAGEGAGFAGGIISAAMDGQNVARAVSRFLTANS